MITIVGLGPGGMDAMSVSALRSVELAERLFVRTGVHPAAEELAARGIEFETFDDVYESAADFETVYETIASKVIEMARTADITYAVPGHPLFAERSVELILDRAETEGLRVSIVGSPSFVEACLEALAVPLGSGLKIIDALSIRHTPPSPDCPNLIHQVYDRHVASELKLALLESYPDDFEVYVIVEAGGANASVEQLPLYALDRRDYNHLTSVYVPSHE